MEDKSSGKKALRRLLRRCGVVFGLLLMITAVVVCIWLVDSINQDGGAGEGVGETFAVPNADVLTIEYEPSQRQLSAKSEYEEAFLKTDFSVEFEKLVMDEIDGDLGTMHLMLYDVTHSKVLYSRNADDKCYPASTTKLMTACVSAQFCDADTEFVVGDELSMVAWDSSVAGLQKGQRLTYEMLLDAVLLPSGNDAAYVMAAGVGRIYAGDDSLSASEAVSVFCDLMNNTAQRIGATNSHFSCPDGYHDDENYVTAADMMKIAVYASSFDCIKNSYQKFEASHTLLTGEKFYWENSNPMINPYSAYYYPYATGMKTGFTDQAGSCLVASAEKDGVEIIAVALGSPSIAQRSQDLEIMMDAAFDCCECAAG